MRDFRSGALWLLGGLALVACGTVTHSSYLETKGFYVLYTVVHDVDAGVRGVAIFRDRGETGTPLELDQGDSVTIDDLAVTGVVSNSVQTYQVALDAGASHTFTLTRAGEDPVVKQVNEQATFAPTFADGGTSFTGGPGDSIVIAWSTLSGAKLTVVSTVNSGTACTGATLESVIDDPGSLTVNPYGLSPDGGACTLTLSFVRTTDATIGAPFFGGSLGTATSVDLGVTLQ
jgi:hypothetical protein